MMQPTSPIELTGTASRFANPVALPAGFTTQLAELCATVSDVVATAEASRDWWPLAMHWSLAGQVPQRAAVIACPTSTAEVATVLALCNRTGVAVTPAGGRSGVVGASLPLFGGVLLDTTAMQGILLQTAISEMTTQATRAVHFRSPNGPVRAGQSILKDGCFPTRPAIYHDTRQGI